MFTFVLCNVCARAIITPVQGAVATLCVSAKDYSLMSV